MMKPRRNQKLLQEITAWPSVLLWNDQKYFFFLRQHQKDKGSSQAHINSYKVSERRHAKSIQYPVLSNSQFIGRKKGLAKPSFQRLYVCSSPIRLTHISVFFVYFMAAISLLKRSVLCWQRLVCLFVFLALQPFWLYFSQLRSGI